VGSPETDPELAAALARALARLGIRPVLWAYRELGSTQDRARELIRAGAPEWTVVLARAQSGGRGRLGARWESPAHQGLYMSVVLVPEVAAERLPELTLVAAVAAADALRRSGVPVQLKWPNDLMVAGAKLGGILGELERAPGGGLAVALGIGVNLAQRPGDFPAALRRRATSVRRITGSTPALERVAGAIARALARRDRQWRARGLTPALRRFRTLSPMVRGATIRVEAADGVFRARTIGLDAGGALRVRRADGAVEALTAGAVHLLRLPAQPSAGVLEQQHGGRRAGRRK
jgi:BirA family biotin operon repressor/biotin-[acetyl-CoA-carboxylase] ligase